VRRSSGLPVKVGKARGSVDGENGPAISKRVRLVPQLLKRLGARPAVALDRGQGEQVRQLAELGATDVQVKLERCGIGSEPSRISEWSIYTMGSDLPTVP
jgi:hypothetical protein